MSSTTVIRIPSDVHAQVSRISALCGEKPGSLLACAWREYIVAHREDLAGDLEQAAVLMRSAALEELVGFAQDAHRIEVDDDELQAALEDPRIHAFLAAAEETHERFEREGRNL